MTAIRDENHPVDERGFMIRQPGDQRSLRRD
jgi:hypothetical protein